MKKWLGRNGRICREKFSLYKLKCGIVCSEEEWIIHNNNILNHSLEISINTDRMGKRKVTITGVNPLLCKFPCNFLHILQNYKWF